MERQGIIVVKAGARIKVDYETYALRSDLDLGFECRRDPEESVYISGNPLNPEQETRFDLNGSRRASVEKAAGQLTLTLVRRYHNLAGQDQTIWKEETFQEIKKLRKIFKFID